MLDVIDLACVRGDRPLFRRLSFSVATGEVLHVRGENGRGKTSLLRILCGLSAPADGEIRWSGQSIKQLGEDYHREMAYIGHQNGIQGELSARENLRITARTDGDKSPDMKSRVDRVLDRLGLARFRDLPAKLLSQGQKRRLALARLLLLERRLWLLDEPYTALDTRSIAVFIELLLEHVKAGGLAVMTSHQELALPSAVRSLSLDP